MSTSDTSRHARMSEELFQLLEDEDGRTLTEMQEDDPHYDVVVDEVESYERDGSRHTTITFDGSISTSVNHEVSVGDVVTLWGGGLGYPRHGFAVNGVVIEWLTPLQRLAGRIKMLADYDYKNRVQLEKGREERAKKLESLGHDLRARIDRFTDARTDFWVEGGDYELFVCFEAQKFVVAAYLSIVDEDEVAAADAFWSLPVGEPDTGAREKNTIFAGERPQTQQARWLIYAWALNTSTFEYDFALQQEKLGLDDGHSGNTLGGAFHLALRVLNGEEV